MSQVPEIRFIKLRHGEDLIAFLVEETEEYILIRRPLAVRIENDFMLGKQLIEVREWIPPLFTETEEVKINKDDLMLITPVRPSFKSRFMDFINDFYEPMQFPKPELKSEQSEKNKNEDVKKDNIIPFLGRDFSGKLN